MRFPDLSGLSLCGSLSDHRYCRLWDKEITSIAAQKKPNSLGGLGYLSGFRNLKFSI